MSLLKEKPSLIIHFFYFLFCHLITSSYLCRLFQEDLNNFALRVIDGVREVIEDAFSGNSPKCDADLVSAEEALEKLKVSKATLYRWKVQQYLTPVKLGRKNFYRTSDIQRLKN